MHDTPPASPGTNRRAWWRRPAFGFYLLGHAAILAGAAGTSITGSMAPLALGASAALMLTVPLLRQLASRRR